MENKQMTELPQIAVEYVDAVIRKMRWRRKVREDVRQELVDHFTDALDHISGEAERQKEAQKLITEFGDAAVLGKLMRRAKKRCRPWWVKCTARLFCVLFLAILLSVSYSVWLLTGEPTIDENYIEQYNEFVRPAGDVDEAENAEIFLSKAVELYLPFDRFVEDNKTCLNGLNPERDRPLPVGEECELLIRRWIDANTETLDMWEEASSKPYYWKTVKADGNTPMTKILLPHLQTYRDIGCLCMWRTYFEAKDSEWDSVIRDIKANYKVGKHLKSPTSILIEQLLGRFFISANADLICRLLNDLNVNREGLEFLKNEFSYLSNEAGFIIYPEVQKFAVCDYIQRSFVETPVGDHLYLKYIKEEYPFFERKESVSFGELMKFAALHPGKQQTIIDAECFFERLTVYFEKQPYEIEKDSWDNIVLKEITANPILGRYLSYWKSIIKLNYKVKSNVETAILILATHLYKADNGSFPESLDRLMCDGYIESVPIDPFSGKQLAYRKTDNSFVLYSVGTDRVDNGGKAEYNDDGNTVKWPKKDGYDAVFWPVD